MMYLYVGLILDAVLMLVLIAILTSHLVNYVRDTAHDRRLQRAWEARCKQDRMDDVT